MCGAPPGHIIRRHLLPSFTSYIIVDLVISFPYMVLSETALSFIGLGLKDPVPVQFLNFIGNKLTHQLQNIRFLCFLTQLIIEKSSGWNVSHLFPLLSTE